MTTTAFTWDINASLPVVLDGGNQYLYGAGLSAMNQSGNWYYYLADGLGSTMAIVDADGDVENGYTYDVYGEPTVTGSLANEFDFAGQQTDATGLQYLRARYYDPETGVFLSRDPLAKLPMWLENSFAYVAAQPTIVADPTGLSPECTDFRWCLTSVATPYGAMGPTQWVEFTVISEYTLYRVCTLIDEYSYCSGGTTIGDTAHEAIWPSSGILSGW